MKNLIKFCCSDLKNFVEYLNSVCGDGGEKLVTGSGVTEKKFNLCPFCGTKFKNNEIQLDENKIYEIKWDPKLDTRVPWIDNQHKKLLDRLNLLLNAIIQKKGSTEAESAIKFLKSYIRAHFGTEESIMLRQNYPGYKNQKKQHDYFIDRIDSFVDEHVYGGISDELVLKLARELWNWFQGHVAKSDKEFGDFLESKNESNDKFLNASADEMYESLLKGSE